MANQNFDVSICYDPDAFPFICMPNDSSPLSKDDLQIDDFYIKELRSSHFHVEDFDFNKFTKTFDNIFRKNDELISIRSVLMMFALKNIIDVSLIFGFIITEDKIKNEITEEEFDQKLLFRENSRYFNDIFYNQLSKHPSLMLDVIETIYSFYSKNSSQYEQSYSIINRIILTNERSLTPVPSSKLNFMEEKHVGVFKKQIIQSFPIILPFSMKYKDYLDEDLPDINVYYNVERKNILNTVWELDSLKNLNIRFHIYFKGEEGIDCGGLTKEFIEAAMKEIFKPETDLFDYRNNYYWFKYHDLSDPSQKEHFKKKYFCIGILLGIVVLNKMTIPIHFPPYFYKKLLHRSINLTDLINFDPGLFQSLMSLMTNEITEDLCIDYIYLDSMSNNEIDLITFKPTDDKFVPTPVVDANKVKYINDVVRWVFDISIKEEFEAFEEGFCKVRRDPMLYHAFRLDELDKIISGEYERNWDQLKESASYSGFKKDSQTIVWFWQYFMDLDEEGKLNVLRFIRASTAVPVGGLKDVIIRFKKVSGHGPPVAHTCFNTIDLPEYESFEQLKDKCDLGFAYSDSFGRD